MAECLLAKELNTEEQDDAGNTPVDLTKNLNKHGSHEKIIDLLSK